MTKVEARQRIAKLKILIDHHRYLYHVLDRQEISPEALDSLKKELFDLEIEFPDLVTPDSPTQRIGGRPLEKFAKVRHPKPMLSWNDAFTRDDLNAWFERNARLLTKEDARNALSFYCEPKLDGLAIELIYESPSGRLGNESPSGRLGNESPSGRLGNESPSRRLGNESPSRRLGNESPSRRLGNENCVFKIGSTRGDGLIGEDITLNLKTIEAIPLGLRDKNAVITALEKWGLKSLVKALKEKGLKEVVVRGEAVITKKDFVKVNKEQERLGLPVYANPRNLAAGSIRQLDPKVTKTRHLDSNAYELLSDLGQETHEQGHLILEALGFKTNNKYNKLCRSLEEVITFHDYWQKNREKLPYEVDGIVVIINDNRVFKNLGVVGKSPRGTLSFKFPLRQATTVVEDIVFQVGRTGAVTPVALLKPVQVGGVTISRATLHNRDEIQRLGLKKGDSVIVGRAGDVIPDIIKVLPELRTGREKNFLMPKNCPSCGSPLVKPAIEVVWRCQNPNCFARKREALYHFVSKAAFDIQGLGPKIIDRFLDEGLIEDAADLFLLQEGDILPLERFAAKSAQNLVLAIQSKTEISLFRFLLALGIRNVGEETCRDLAETFGTLENLQKATLSKLQNIQDIGPVVAKSIYNYFQNKKNLLFLAKLKKVGIAVQEMKPKVQNTKLKGLTFVFTGELETITRNQAKERVRQLGGDISESVSQNISFVVVGLNPGSKFIRAKKLGNKIISETEFLKMVG